MIQDHRDTFESREDDLFVILSLPAPMLFSAESKVAWFIPGFDSPRCTVLCSGVYANLGQEVLPQAAELPEAGRLRGSINCSKPFSLALFQNCVPTMRQSHNLENMLEKRTAATIHTHPSVMWT